MNSVEKAQNPPAPDVRRAARVLLVDEADRVLLVRVTDPTTSRTWWATPGGGLDPGESFEAAAHREIAEETGLRGFELGPCVWTREFRGHFLGLPVHVHERLFFARVAAFEPTSDGYTELERRVQSAARWWTAVELHASQATFAPSRFVALFGDLIQAGPPFEPIDVGE
jgi:8-oxo-dGTP pyrophosphatase MutT (NUDIX family)